MRLLSILLVLFCVSCDSPAADPKKVVTNAEISSVVDYGEGVYYFPYIQQNFGNALASFLRKNPSLQVTAIAGNGALGYGADMGYFVTCQTKTVAESDATIPPLAPSAPAKSTYVKHPM